MLAYTFTNPHNKKSLGVRSQDHGAIPYHHARISFMVSGLFVQRHFAHVFFCPFFFYPTTFSPISKKRSLVKETFNPKPYWTKGRG